MKAMIVAAVTTLSLGTSAAFAQGAPPGFVPQSYGSAWAAKTVSADNLRTSTQARGGQAVAPRAAEGNTSLSALAAKGG